MIVSPKNRRSVEEVFRDYCGRHSAIVKALTTDIERFYLICDPEQDNLCLFGHANGDWELGFPAEDVPTELPEPVVGINFARDGMKEKDWLLLVAAHSDAWLLSVAFYFGGRFGFGSVQRKRLFAMINELPTVSEMVTGTLKAKSKSSGSTSNNTKKDKSGSKGGGSASGKKSKKGKEDEEEDLDENADAVAIADADADVDEGFDGKYKEADGETETLCGVCGEAYETNQFWICCDKCDKWFHGKCVNVTEARADHIKQYKCPSCSKRGRHNNSS